MSRYNYYIGIDPGKNGAIVVLNDKSVETVVDMPDTVVKYKDFLMHYNDRVVAIVEKVSSMPGNGGVMMFTFGYGVGMLHTMLEMCYVPFELHTPQKWMKFYSMHKEKTESKTEWKNRLKTRAQQLFPDIKVTLGNADALLIAYYCRETKRCPTNKLLCC